METVSKLWGREDVIVNNDKYCLKRLHLIPGWACSLHRHTQKDETFIIEDGHCTLEVNGETREMYAGEQFRIFPGTWHRFSLPRNGTHPCIILEVSTHHDDGDCERREASKPCQT